VSEIDPEELRDQVLFSLLIPAARLAVRHGIPLRDVKRAIELAYYRETRNSGLTMREIVKIMNVSMRKVGMLSNDLKAVFSRPDAEYGLSRRIMSLLLAGPMTRARIIQAFEEFEERVVENALDTLVVERKIAESDDRTPRYSLTSGDKRLVTTPWVAKIDALAHLMSNVSSVVSRRFFDTDDAAFARTLNFRVSPESPARLRELYEEQVFPATVELERDSGDDGVSMNLSILWGPDEPT
jgi:Arc/MetJ family transcription regulator